MAIEDIFRALEEQAEAECNQIVHAAEAQATAIVAEAEAEAERIKEQKLQAAEEVGLRKVGKTINAARLENRKHLAAVREAALQRVFDDAAAKLAALRGTDSYEEVLKTLAEQALAGANGDCTVLVDSADTKLAEKVVKSMAPGCGVDGAIETVGGLVVSSNGGRVVRRNTFESRLAKSREFAHARVAEILG